jgi:hypothetical protein
MSRATRKLQQRCQALGDQAKGLVTRGQHDEALARLDEALAGAGAVSGRIGTRRRFARQS